MYIKEIKKKNKNSDKIYTYYRLVHSYKVGNKIRHQTIVGLGKLENIDREHHKLLADRIEEIITGNTALLFPDMERSTEIREHCSILCRKNNKRKIIC